MKVFWVSLIDEANDDELGWPQIAGGLWLWLGIDLNKEELGR